MYFAVIQERGANWDDARPMRAQEGWDEHAAFIDALADEGFAVLVGPLGDGTTLHRALLVFDADSEDAIRARLADDPWTGAHMLRTVSIDRWEIVIGRPHA
jgi:uncharacterized protein YciI